MLKNVPTKEELQMIRDYCLLPIMLTMVENSRRQIEYAAALSIRQLYLAAVDALLRKIQTDLSAVKSGLREHKIKVFEDERQDRDGRYYRFVCRGYEDNFVLIRDLIRAEISIRLSSYITEVISAATTRKEAGKSG